MLRPDSPRNSTFLRPIFTRVVSGLVIEPKPWLKCLQMLDYSGSQGFSVIHWLVDAVSTAGTWKHDFWHCDDQMMICPGNMRVVLLHPGKIRAMGYLEVTVTNKQMVSWWRALIWSWSSLVLCVKESPPMGPPSKAWIWRGCWRYVGEVVGRAWNFWKWFSWWSFLLYGLNQCCKSRDTFWVPQLNRNQGSLREQILRKTHWKWALIEWKLILHDGWWTWNWTYWTLSNSLLLSLVFVSIH